MDSAEENRSLTLSTGQTMSALLTGTHAAVRAAVDAACSTLPLSLSPEESPSADG